MAAGQIVMAVARHRQRLLRELVGKAAQEMLPAKAVAHRVRPARGDRRRPAIVERRAERGADDFVAALPAGYATQLGRRFDEGHELSLGHWQRLALADAFFRDAPFVIMDEPTATLDARAESELFDAMRPLLRPRRPADLAPLLERPDGRRHLRPA